MLVCAASGALAGTSIASMPACGPAPSMPSKAAACSGKIAISCCCCGPCWGLPPPACAEAAWGAWQPLCSMGMLSRSMLGPEACGRSSKGSEAGIDADCPRCMKP